MPRISWKELAAPAALLVAFTAFGLHALRTVAPAFDEQHYLVTARELAHPGWSTSSLAYIQPPLGLWAAGWSIRGVSDADLFRGVGLLEARATMLAAGIIGAAVLYLWLRRALGLAPALLGLACYCLHPLLIGYSALVCVDIWHALAMLALAWATTRVLAAPGVTREAVVGLALGAALATKYFALLAVPVIAVIVPAAAWWHSARSDPRRGVPARAARAVAGLALCAFTALLALHACHGFSAGLRGFEGPWWQAALPAPYAAGLEFARGIGATPHGVFLDGDIAPGHWDYYLSALVRKSPLGWLALVAAAVVVRSRAWLRNAGASERQLVLVCAALAAAQLVPLSLLTSFQLGVRYVLPVLPLGCAIAACAALPDAATPRVPRWRAVALALGVAAIGAAAWGARRDPIAHFNSLDGGQAAAYRHFDDSNCDWRQGFQRGRTALAARHGPELVFLHAGEGPRLGLVAAYSWNLAPPDPRDPSRARHWLDPLTPIDRDEAAWYVFDASESALRAACAADPDPRRRQDLAVALLGAGRVAEAHTELRAIGRAADSAIARLATLLGLPELGLEEQRMVVALWLRAARPDRAIEAAVRIPRAELGSARSSLAVAYATLGRTAELEELVLSEPLERRSTGEILVLAQCFRDGGRLVDAVDVLMEHDAKLLAEAPDLARQAIRAARNDWQNSPAWVREALMRRRSKVEPPR